MAVPTTVVMGKRLCMYYSAPVFVAVENCVAHLLLVDVDRISI